MTSSTHDSNGDATGDPSGALQELAADIWTWRAGQQPSTGDDIPRLPRPAGWLPDFSAEAVAQARARRQALADRWAALAVGGLDVEAQVDHRLLGSVLCRVAWELDVLQSWRRDPVFHVHQALGPYYDLLLPLPPFDDLRAAAIESAIEGVPRALDVAQETLDEPTGPLTTAAMALLDGVGDRLAQSVNALVEHLPAGRRDELTAALPAAVAALDRFHTYLAGLGDLSDVVGVGEEALVWFLRNVALMAETPAELVSRARQEWERAVVWELIAKQRAQSAPPAHLPATADEQIAREAAAAAEVRAFYESADLLSQPDSLRDYLNAALPDYLAPLRFLGVSDDLTDDRRLDQDGVSYVPPPGADLPYFYAANARDPRAGIVHEGAHYQQLAMSYGHPNPVRRRYYDSTANEGIAFYNEEMLLQAGLFDDAPHTRAVIWNFARLRALRVEADVHLAIGVMGLEETVDFFVQRVPMDRETAFEETSFYAGNPGLALSYQTGKLQLLSLIAAAAGTEGFSLRTIHDAVWRDGNVPFSLLRWQLLGDRSVLDAVDADPATGAPVPVMMRP